MEDKIPSKKCYSVEVSIIFSSYDNHIEITFKLLVFKSFCRLVQMITITLFLWELLVVASMHFTKLKNL